MDNQAADRDDERSFWVNTDKRSVPTEPLGDSGRAYRGGFRGRAFSRRDRALGDKASFEKTLLQSDIVISDLRKAIEQAAHTLAEDGTSHRMVAGLASTNMRAGLDLFRAILKSLTGKKILQLKLGAYGEHMLILAAMRERRTVYYEATSKIRNLFNPRPAESYFATLYVLCHLRRLQQGPKNDSYVRLDDWERAVRQAGIPRDVFEKTAWHLMCGDFALVEAEIVDPSLPGEWITRYDDLSADTLVRPAAAALYYADWLAADVSYLECVLEDTPMPEHLARETARLIKSNVSVFDYVSRFLEFLYQKERDEQAAWAYAGECGPFVNQLQSRLRRQEETWHHD